MSKEKEKQGVTVENNEKPQQEKEEQNVKNQNHNEDVNEESQMGTIEKLKDIFKFRKLKREQRADLKLDEESTMPATVLPNEDQPPPLPAKPSLDSPVRINIGTRIDL